MPKITLFFLSIFLLSVTVNAQHQLLIGTYTNKGSSEGIYVYDFNSKKGTASLKSVAKAIVNPSYLTLSPDRKYVYSVNENGKASAVTAFKYNEKSGTLDMLNQRPAGGGDPCFITADGKNVVLANYSGGSVTIIEIEKDGSLGNLKQTVVHTGKSVHPKRQTTSHVHQVVFSPDKKYILVNDLGEDQVYCYVYDNASEKPLTLGVTVKTAPGSGPRHLTFHPNGKFVYLTHELNGKIAVYAYHDGKLSLHQEISTTVPDFEGRIDAADIHVSSDGRFLYQTNRGDLNTISVFAILKNGMLNRIETLDTKGRGPRNFTIDPSGRYLLIAHQQTDDVVIFQRNKKTGKLTDTGNRIKVGAPVCLVFPEN